MLCQNCQRDNPDDASFCSGCGQPIQLVCESCARANAPDASLSAIGARSGSSYPASLRSSSRTSRISSSCSRQNAADRMPWTSASRLPAMTCPLEHRSASSGCGPAPQRQTAVSLPLFALLVSCLRCSQKRERQQPNKSRLMFSCPSPSCECFSLRLSPGRLARVFLKSRTYRL